MRMPQVRRVPQRETPRRWAVAMALAAACLALAWPSRSWAEGAVVPGTMYSFGASRGMTPLMAKEGGWTFKLWFGKADGIGNIPLLVEVREARRRPELIAGMSASLSMPTMPEMGVDHYVLSRDPLGQYVSAPLISMGGPWRVELAVERNGKPPLTVPFEVDFEEPGKR